jgi:signal transduction histidine kinase
MAAGPAMTGFILAVIVFSLVPQVSIGGSIYSQLMYGKDFEVASVAPSLYIIEIHSEVEHLLLHAGSGESTTAIENEIAGKQSLYERDYQSWVTRITDAETSKYLVTSHTASTEYFKSYKQQLLPIIHAHRYADAEELLSHGDMARAFEAHRVATQLAAELVQSKVVTQEKAAKEKAGHQELGILAVTLLIIAASTALALTILRSITDRVRHLNEVATVELPQILNDVKRAAIAGEEIPEMPDIQEEGNDELAAAATAFNAVITTAVGLAADQSKLRRSTSQMFINLGRRNHKLLSRTLTYITQRESDERDPGTLQNLFRLDHLTTRMRRHAESLLVLAGSPPLRTWSRPVPVADVLRAALSEIETYDRVDVKELEPVEVRGASVSDLAHLLAELLENATAFSPPQTRVRVLGRIDSDGYTVVVVDEGIGMSPGELESANRLINGLDGTGLLNDSRMLGLGVVGRLAARHGFKVNLTASPVGGVVAWVTLPMSVLAPRRGAADSDLSGGISTAELMGSADNLPSRPSFTSRTVVTNRKEAGPAGPAPQFEESGHLPQQTGWACPPTYNGQPITANGTSAASPLTPAPLGRPGDDRPGSTPGTEPDPDIEAAAAAAARSAAADQDVSARSVAGENQHTPAPEYPQNPASALLNKTGGEVPGEPRAVTPAAPTGSFTLPPRAPEATPPVTGTVIIPPAPKISPVSGPITFRKPTPGPGEPTTLTRRVRGAQLPDTGDTLPAGPPGDASRPERSPQSVRGALQSFNAGRRTASKWLWQHQTGIWYRSTSPSTDKYQLSQ